jgi:hypothetical protein
MSTRWLLLIAISTTVMLTTGCGKPTPVTAKGIVKLNGKPQANVKVLFYPDVTQFDPERHGSGFAITDAEGNYDIQSPSGEKGIWPGNYKVSFVLWVDSKGNVVPADAKPSEVPGGVKNLFPAQYEAPSTTPETVIVTGSGLTKDFDIQS